MAHRLLYVPTVQAFLQVADRTEIYPAATKENSCTRATSPAFVPCFTESGLDTRVGLPVALGNGRCFSEPENPSQARNGVVLTRCSVGKPPPAPPPPVRPHMPESDSVTHVAL
eukprot:8206109-Pyramimonas_sp.AAC.1